MQNDGLAAYVDGSGNLYIPGNDEPINENSADAIISIDSYRLTFLSVTDEGTDDEQTALVVIDLTTFEESVVDSSVYAACMIDDDLYYVSDTDRTQLYLADFENDLVNLLYTSEESIDGLYESVDGLVVTFVEDAGAVLYVESTDSFEPYGNETPEQSAMTEDYQVYIADGSTLYIQEPDSLGADTVDTNVFSFTLLNDKIYYLANTGSAVRLKVYDPEELEQKVLLTLEISIDETQLAASQTMLFLLGDDDVVYSVDPDTGDMEAFLTIQAPELSDDTQVDSYFIEGMNGQINVYATLTDAEETPTFSFMEFTTDVDNVSEDFTLVKITQIDGEDLAWTLLEPAEQYTPLSRGSRGDAVSAIQQPLYDHGYYDYYIDGIFGIRTDRAVRLLQEDLGLTVNGIADEELQKIILSGDFPDYDPYAQIDYGDRGLRVKSMQQRLRSLGYLADAADGIFGVRTQAAVQLFQLENDITVSENATRETLVALYSSSASKCSSYIELKLGDTGYRVRELNKRLKELYYLEGSVTDTYTSATADAIRLFQAQVGLVINGNEASTSLQQRLFASGAPEYSGYITLRRGDESARVARLQRRLKELNYFSGNITGYYGSKTQAAVKLFQQTVGIRPTGVATVRTQELLFSPYAHAYVKPTVIGTPTFSLDGYDKLESGVYCLSETSTDSGYVTFSWYAEGDVESYNVTIIDDQGPQYLDQDTMLTMTSVQVATLSMDRVYTITITAYPSDGDTDHITSAALSFKRIEASDEDEDAIGTITSVTASIDNVTRTEDDVNYVRTGTITFRWYAEGDVASYYVEIIDASGNVLLECETTDEQASTTTDSMCE